MNFFHVMYLRHIFFIFVFCSGVRMVGHTSVKVSHTHEYNKTTGNHDGHVCLITVHFKILSLCKNVTL